jgi:hypothetical protein
MAGKGKKWLIGCGAGCGVVILLNILLVLGAGLLISQPMNKAVESQKALAEAHGLQDEYLPDAGGPTPDRMEAFLAVRRALMPSCEKFEEITGGFAAMEELDKGDEEPGAMEIFKGLGKVMGSVKGLVTEMGKVLEVRNKALLAEGMGLGEYTWIYVLAYNSWLNYEPNTGIEDDGGSFTHREQSLIADMMIGYADALAAAGRSEEAEVWRTESRKLDWSDTGVPFSEGMIPPAMAEVFEPYRARLEDTYCPPMSEFDLSQIKKKGLSFHTN